MKKSDPTIFPTFSKNTSTKLIFHRETLNLFTKWRREIRIITGNEPCDEIAT